MPQKFVPTISKELFVGRSDDLELLKKYLHQPQAQWIISLVGDGGIGKTRLLEHFAEYALGQGYLVTSSMIDFYNPTYQVPAGVFQGLVERIGLNHFPSFGAQLKLWEQRPEGHGSEPFEVIQQLTAAFLQDYRALVETQQRIVILFDTCEEMRAAEYWMLHTLLPRIYEIEREVFAAKLDGQTGEPFVEHFPVTTLIILAGRTPLNLAPELEPLTHAVNLEPFQEPQVRDFFEQGEMEEIYMDEELVKSIYTMTNGRPLYIALCFDWLKNGVGTIEELLRPGEPLGAKLGKAASRLDNLEGQAILYTALAWRRMEPSLLARLVETDGVEGADRLLRQLQRFSFVKYRLPAKGFAGSFQLQDEMRFLILRHVWPQHGEATQKEVLAEVIRWYEDTIKDEAYLKGKSVPAPDQQERTLVVEWIYYNACYNAKVGFELMDKPFRTASHQRDMDFCQMLNQEIWRFEDGLTSDQRDHTVFREGLIQFRYDRTDLAYSYWYSLLQIPTLDKVLRVTTLLNLVELEADTGKVEDAIRHAEEADLLFEALLSNPSTKLSADEMDSLVRQRGQLLNNWGYAYRKRGDWKTAIEFYKRVLDVPGRPKNKANTLNNLGYAYAQQGDLIRAKSYVGKGLGIRKDLGISYELGLSYNTMGIIHEESGILGEALRMYDRAHHIFKGIGNDKGCAMASLNLGRLKRNTNEFDDAINNLEDARRIFASRNYPDYLIRCLNELGCAYRERAQNSKLSDTSDWKLAYKHLAESLRLSQQQALWFNEADNWEDMGILHCYHGIVLRDAGQPLEAQEHFERARAAVDQAIALTEAHDSKYLRAKAAYTEAEISFLRGSTPIPEVLDRYLDACILTAHALMDEQKSRFLVNLHMQRVSDRLQEHIHNLPSQVGKREVERLIQIIDDLPDELHTKLDWVRNLLDVSINVDYSDIADE